jgi:hypothetical protein
MRKPWPAPGLLPHSPLMRTITSSTLAISLLLTATVMFGAGLITHRYLHPPVTHTIHTSDADEAKGALITFLNALHHKDYALAAATYGGDYAQLQDWNPDVAPTSYTTLWERGCTTNGLHCLEPRNIVFASQPGPTLFTFNVWFNSPDSPQTFAFPDGRSMFALTVIKDETNGYLVETPLPYQP